MTRIKDKPSARDAQPGPMQVRPSSSLSLPDCQVNGAGLVAMGERNVPRSPTLRAYAPLVHHDSPIARHASSTPIGIDAPNTTMDIEAVARAGRPKPEPRPPRELLREAPLAGKHENLVDGCTCRRRSSCRRSRQIGLGNNCCRPMAARCRRSICTMPAKSH